MAESTWTTSQGTRIERIGGMRCNCYLVQTGSRTFLIDTGHSSEFSKMRKQLRDKADSSVDAILLTHGHADHAGNASKIQQTFGCPVFIHKSELDALHEGSSGGADGITRWGKAVSKLQKASHYGEKIKAVDRVTPLSEDSSLNPHLRIIETPGHSIGSICVVVDDEYALVGDTIAHRGIEVFPPFADLPDSIPESWSKLLMTGSRSFLPGHGTETPREFLVEAIRRLGAVS